MQNTATVFVLGAGSRAEFDLPVGSKLSVTIEKYLDFWFNEQNVMVRGDGMLYRAFQNYAGKAFRDYIQSARTLSAQMSYSNSIDDAIFNHSEDPRVAIVGKAGIAKAILEAEKASKLKDLTEHDIQKNKSILHGISDTWAFKLFTHLQTGIKRSNVESLFDGVAFVNFNCDRCVEHVFYHLVRDAYSLSFGEAAKVMRRLKIVHPYGRVGPLPWEGGKSVEYGFEAVRTDIISLAARLSTLSEKTYSSDELIDVKNVMSSARRVVFLGFSFHKQNMEILSLGNDTRKIPVVATTFGASGPDIAVYDSLIERTLTGLTTNRPQFVASTCSEFMSSHGRWLAADAG